MSYIFYAFGTRFALKTKKDLWQKQKDHSKFFV